MTQSRQPHPFVDQLEKLRENRAALAALRRGLGQRPGTVAEMYPYVVPYLPKDAPRAVESAYYTVAALFAYHPASTTSGNIGEHLAHTIKGEADRAATERRFVALLNTHPDDLPHHLRQTISYLKSKEQPINWDQLLRDLLAWDHPDRYVQRRWASAFWGRRAVSAEEDTTKE